MLLGKRFVGAGVEGRHAVLKRLIEAIKFLPVPTELNGKITDDLALPLQHFRVKTRFHHQATAEGRHPDPPCPRLDVLLGGTARKPTLFTRRRIQIKGFNKGQKRVRDCNLP